MQCIVDKYHEYHKAKLMLWDIIHYANVTVSNLTKDFDYTSEIEEIELKLCRHFAGHHAWKPIDEQTEECVKYVREEVCKQS